MSKTMRLIIIAAIASVLAAQFVASAQNKNAPGISKADPNAAKLAKLKADLAGAQAQLKKEEGRNVEKDIQNDAAYKSFMSQSQRALGTAEAKRLGNLPGGEAYKRAAVIR